MGRAIGPLMGALLYFFLFPQAPYFIAAAILLVPVVLIKLLPRAC